MFNLSNVNWDKSTATCKPLIGRLSLKKRKANKSVNCKLHKHLFKTFQILQRFSFILFVELICTIFYLDSYRLISQSKPSSYLNQPITRKSSKLHLVFGKFRRLKKGLHLCIPMVDESKELRHFKAGI